MKVCSRCELPLNDNCFRVRVEKRIGKECTYLNNTCKKCDAEIGRLRHRSIKDNPLYKEKNRVRAKNWRKDNIDYVTEKLKDKRQTEEYKEYVKAYYENNHDKIRQQAKKTNDKYISNERLKITDMYAITLICHPRNNIQRKDVTREMIETKKICIAIDRLKKIINKYNNG